MSAMLTGPIVRQLVQFAAGVTAATGFASESEITTLIGAIGSVGNILWMIYARLKAR